MDYNNFKEKIYYMNLKDILGYSFITTCIFSFALIMSFFNEQITYNLFDMFALILSIILLMFSIHLESITKKPIYGLLQLYFLINCFIQMIALTPDGYFQVLKVFLKKIEYSQVYNFRFINRILLYYMLSKYREIDNKNKKIYIEYFSILISLTTLIYLNSKYYWIITPIIYIISISVLLILAYKYIYSYNIEFNKKIDLLKLNLFFTTFDYVIRILATRYSIYTINNISGVVMQIVFISTLIAIIFNITKENYNFVFKETIDTSKHLENINRKIIKNNYKLEETYRKLKDKQGLYKSFLGRLPNPIVIINNNLRIVYCNSKFLKEVQKDNLREVVNKRIDNYIDFNYDLSKIGKEFKGSPYASTITLNNKKIELRLFNLNIEELEYIILFKDLTEEIKLSEMKEELENIKIREEIKKNFLSNISHDLKIPVNVIYSAIQLEKILIDNNNIEKIKMYNDISKENCFILTKFTNNLIDISKIDSENLQVNLILDNIVEFIEDYLFSLSPYINNSGIETIFDTDEEEIYIYFDKEMMQRVILNLVSNSIKFTSSGGIISIKIKNFKDYVLIEVSDNGLGMSKEFINKAFNKYEMESRCKNNNPTGFGVGLFVVYNLIKAQNGSININSEVGKGTTFIIKLYK
ncbi:sensor histidine kinase KdpD [uncultured Clostridium sp.]|uniref:sensor histidine kinase n=1 Tax=uncultured Clostridium sp. TaxID=59620 RepID=UPI00258FB828|nr:HAMP domain-containing sensor histidine kinase [uncultured Clostridium sp.]